MNETTVLFPGGFKPITGAHLALAQRYAESPNVERVIMLIGPKERDGVSRQDSDEIFRLINTNPKIELRSTDFNSPIMAAYEFLFALPQDDMGTYAMAASRKGDDYARTMSFGSNVEKYKTIGDKKGRKIPPGVDINPMEVDVEPLTYEDGQPISASTIRQAIVNNDYETFAASYPGTKEAILKNIWQMLNGVQEATFSKEWWGNALAEDIEEVIEGYQTPDLANAHTAKMKKLRKYLDASQGKEFAYDFKKFKKTVFGVKLTESVLQENYITRSELSQIEAAADSFFSQYGIDVDMQGQFTHFFERLNDPRNDSPINMDELEDMFRKLAQEHGSRIQRQIELERPSAVASDLESDIHMPFMLKWDVKNKTIDLIPRTIKKQRRDWRVNNPNDIHYKLYAEGMLTEGGAAGHMNHPYDSHGLTFNDMKEIVSRALEGRLDMEQAVTEKTDGQNIQVTWKNGQPGFARGMKTRKEPLTPAEIVAEFEAKYQKAVESNGVKGAEGYKLVVNAFRATAEDLTASLNKLSAETLQRVFKNGRVFANMEIIYPATTNVIAYEQAVLQFHNLVEYDENGKVIETDVTGGTMLQKIIQDANAHMQNTFSFIPPNKLKLGRIEDFEDKQSAFFAEIDSLKNQFGLKETDVVSEYHKAWWKDVISKKASQMDYAIPEDVLDLLTYRWALNDKSTNITKIKKLIDNEQFSEWVAAFDKKDFRVFQKQNIEPFESIFLRLGAVVLKNIKNYLAVSPDTAVKKIKQDLLALIKELQTSDNPATLKKLETELKKIERIGGFDSIVPIEGIVFTYGGNTYKLTGSFAPVNQILGVLKYAR
tara:strand:+ start:632 stop:3109 length:2478 start_codon:yes stop_codon:yes gene_type:complete